MSDTPPLLSAEDALQPQPPIPWVADGLLVAGGLSILFGDPGCRKTWAALDLACSVAAGQPWLEHATNPSPVLLIDEESGRRRLLSRLGDVLRGHDLGAITPVFAATMRGYNFTQPEDVADIAALIATTSARLCIIDSLAATFGGADENAVSDVQPIMSALRVVADASECHILLIHHANKMGGYRGSSALKGAVDLLLLVQSEPLSCDIKLTVEKSRDFEPRTFGARANWELGHFWLSPQTIEAEESMPRSHAFVLRYLGEHDQATVTAIENAADVCSARTAKNAVYTLAAMGKIRRVDSGGRGTDAVYELALQSGNGNKQLSLLSRVSLDTGQGTTGRDNWK